MSGISYIWPVPQRPTFAWGRYPSGGYHPAYDLPSPTGTAVHAPAAGRIIQAGWDDTGYGIHVRILHSWGHVSILAHNESLLVVAGQMVRQGQQVSWSDSTGRSSGPHVHWETRTSATGLQRLTAYDPGPYIGAGMSFSGPSESGFPTGPSDGPPVVPSPAWYGNTPGLIIPPAAETITGEAGAPAEARFSPVRIAA